MCLTVLSIKQEDDTKRSNKAKEKAHKKKNQKNGKDPTEEAAIAKKEKEKKDRTRERDAWKRQKKDAEAEQDDGRKEEEKKRSKKKEEPKKARKQKKTGCATGQTQGSNAWGCEWLQAPGFEGAGCLRQGVDNSLRQGRSVAAQETLH